MTRERWDDLWLEHFNVFYANGRSVDRARIRATEEMEHRFGPRPSEEGLRGLPLKYRIGLNVVLSRVRGLAPVEVSPMVQRLIVALVYGIGAAGPVLAAALSDAVIAGNEWGGIISAFVVAFWGKFSSSTTILSPARAGETQASKPGVTL